MDGPKNSCMQHKNSKQSKANVNYNALTIYWNICFSSENCRLTLPEDLKASEIKWLSVWCRRFTISFGDLFFSEDMEIVRK